MSESPQREWRFYIDDMIGFAEKVVAYTAGLDQRGFIDSAIHYDATVRNLELIGEAATHEATDKTVFSYLFSGLPRCGATCERT